MSAVDHASPCARRYREKRKRRTFEKTIRYESRKAYAEVHGLLHRRHNLLLLPPLTFRAFGCCPTPQVAS